MILRAMRRTIPGIILTATLAASACSAAGSVEEVQSEAPEPSTSSTSSTSTTQALSESTETTEASTDVDLTALPLGDGKTSSEPARGYIYSCQTNFNGPAVDADAPWIDEATDTWDRTQKVTVDGEVEWPSSFTISLEGNERVLTGNGLPDHTTGEFPISPDDEAYQYDRNPNSIDEQVLQIDLAATPTVADEPSCLNGGGIGVLLSGSLLFNGFDAAGNDAVAHEVQDECHGHPSPQESYHYHDLTTCIDDEGTGHSALVGYAFDGFGIYGPRGEDGEVLTNADLDECHGHTHEIEWDGEVVEMYHYHATYEFPYTLGCYRGTPGTFR